MNGIPPFAIHDPGCNCWPHVNASDLDEATIAGAVTEYREGKRAIDRAVAARNAEIAAAVRRLATPDDAAHADSMAWSADEFWVDGEAYVRLAAVLAIVESVDITA